MARAEEQAKTILQVLEDQTRVMNEQTRILQAQAGIDSSRVNDQQDVSNVLKDQLKQLKFQASEKTLLRKLTNDINNIASQGYALGKEALGTEKGINKLQKDRIGLEGKIRLLKQQEIRFSKEGTQLGKDLASTIRMQTEEAIKLNMQLGKISESSESIGDSLGVKAYGALADLTKAIPGLSRFSGPFEEAAEAARSTVTEMESTNMGIDKFKELRAEGVGVQEALEMAGVSAKEVTVGKFTDAQKSAAGLNAGFESIGKKISSIAIAVTIFTKLFKMMGESDKAAGDLAKNMNVSYKEAQNMRNELRNQALESGNTSANVKSLSESMVAINSTLGTNVALNKEDLNTFTELREVAGFTNEELMGMQSLSLATGKSLEDNTKEFMAQATQASLANGVLLNEKELMKEISKVSASTTLSLGKNPKELAKAVATAKSLGMEMSQLEGIADSLLDFESSIENELQAELLLGKNLNLEKARTAALNNDLATVAKEIASQAGSAAEFGQMNRIQQEALAKSVGMSKEDLAKTLFIQEQLAGATGDEAEKREKLLNDRIAEVGLAQATKELENGSLENMENQASQQARMAAMVERISESFMTIADTIMTLITPVVDILAPIFNGIASAVQLIATGFRELPILMVPMLGILGAMMIKMKGAAILAGIKGAWSALGSIPFVGPALAVAAIAGVVGAVSKYSKAGDVNSPAAGKTQISTKEGGLFELSDNDDVVAFPGASKMAQNRNKPSQQSVTNTTVVKPDNSKMESLLSKLVMQNDKKQEISPVGLYEIA